MESSSTTARKLGLPELTELPTIYNFLLDNLFLGFYFIKLKRRKFSKKELTLLADGLRMINPLPTVSREIVAETLDDLEELGNIPFNDQESNVAITRHRELLDVMFFPSAALSARNIPEERHDEVYNAWFVLLSMVRRAMEAEAN